MNKEIIIIWDIDDVLNNFTKEWLNWYNKQNKKDFLYLNLYENPPCRYINIKIEDYLNSIDCFRKEKFLKLKPRKEIIEWFKKSPVEKIFNIALTSIPEKFIEMSSFWLFKNFKTWIKGFFSVPTIRNSNLKQNKENIIKLMKKVDIFIDDNEQNVNSIKNFVKHSLIFPAPWNKERKKTIPDFLRELDEIIRLYI